MHTWRPSECRHRRGNPAQARGRGCWQWEGIKPVGEVSLRRGARESF